MTPTGAIRYIIEVGIGQSVWDMNSALIKRDATDYGPASRCNWALRYPLQMILLRLVAGRYMVETIFEFEHEGKVSFTQTRSSFDDGSEDWVHLRR